MEHFVCFSLGHPIWQILQDKTWMCAAGKVIFLLSNFKYKTNKGHFNKINLFVTYKTIECWVTPCP